MRKVPWIDRLVVRPRPKEGESFTGYLIRVTEANAYPSLGFILGHADGNIGGFTKVGKEKEARQQWRALETALDLPEGEFQRRWPRQTYTSDMWQPAPLGYLPLVKADHALGNPQVCPECLSEDGHCHALWEIRYYTVCHRHRRLMVSNCGACGEPLSVKRPALRRCGSCDADLLAACKPVRGEPVSWAIADLVAKGVAGQTCSPTDYEGFDFPWHLVDEPLIIVEAVRTMGWMTEMMIKQWLAAGQSAEVRQTQLVRTVKIFEQWPVRWRNLLERKLTERARIESTIRGRVLHHERCMLATESMRLRFMKQALADWISERHPAIWTLKAFKPLAPVWQLGAQVVRGKDAAKALGRSTVHIHWMARKGLLTSAPDVLGGSRFLVTRESLDRAVEEMDKSINWMDARKTLDCHYHLIYDDWFREIIGAKQLSHCGRLYIPRERIKWLVEQLVKARVKRVPRGEVVHMKQVVSMISRTGGSSATILRLILEGSLQVYGFHRQRGIRSLTFYRRDIEALRGRPPALYSSRGLDRVRRGTGLVGTQRERG